MTPIVDITIITPASGPNSGTAVSPFAYCGPDGGVVEEGGVVEAGGGVTCVVAGGVEDGGVVEAGGGVGGVVEDGDAWTSFVVVIVSASVDTVPPNARTLPVILTLLPIVTPTASSIVPAKLLFAPSVVAAVGTQDTSGACAPFRVTTEFATVVSAPSILKI